MKVMQLQLGLTDNDVWVLQGEKSTATKQKKQLYEALDRELEFLKNSTPPLPRIGTENEYESQESEDDL